MLDADLGTNRDLLVHRSHFLVQRIGVPRQFTDEVFNAVEAFGGVIALGRHAEILTDARWLQNGSPDKSGNGLAPPQRQKSQPESTLVMTVIGRSVAKVSAPVTARGNLTAWGKNAASMEGN